MPRIRPTHLLAAALPIAGLARAQQPTTRDTATLGAVVVTATRVALPTAAPTASSTVLDGVALRERGVLSVADALREVPGMTVVQQVSWG